MPAPPLGLTARAVVDRVIDGDTIVVMVQWPVTIRLRDCWAAEQNTEAGKEATAYMDGLTPVGSKIVFQAASKDADSLGDLMSFGRVIGDVWVDGRDESVSEIMVSAGHATARKSR